MSKIFLRKKWTTSNQSLVYTYTKYQWSAAKKNLQRHTEIFGFDLIWRTDLFTDSHLLYNIIIIEYFINDRLNSCYNLWQIIPKALAGSLAYRQTGLTSQLWDGSIMNKWTNTSLRKVLTPTSSTPHPKDNDITPHTTPRGQSYWTPPHLFVSSHYWDSSLLWTISEHAHLHKLKCEHVAIWITCLYFLLITYVHIV